MLDYTHHLRQADIFYNFTPPQLEQVAQFCQERTCQLGETIFTEGSTSLDFA